MPNREPPGYDDWFDDPEPPTVESGRGNRQSYDIPGETEEDVWVLPEDEARRARRGGRRGDVVIGGRSLTTTQIAILAIAALAVIIALLAAIGVFDSSTPAGMQTNSTHTTTTHHTTTTTHTTPTIQAPTQQPLQLNDTGPQVKLLQKALAALGFPPGPADGSFGTGTQQAVENFQAANELTQDGVVGHDTLVAIQQQVRALGG